MRAKLPLRGARSACSVDAGPAPPLLTRDFFPPPLAEPKLPRLLLKPPPAHEAVGKRCWRWLLQSHTKLSFLLLLLLVRAVRGHMTHSSTLKAGSYLLSPCSIARGVWLGLGCIVLRGCLASARGTCANIFERGKRCKGPDLRHTLIWQQTARSG